MPTIAEVRQKFPDYNDMSDTELASALHKKFYSDLPEAEFNAKIGLGTAAPKAAAPADDHGLARRQAMTPAEKAVSPITEYPRHQREISSEALHQMGRGFGQIAEGAFGSGLAGDTGKFAAGLGNVGLGAFGYTFSPLASLVRSIAGQPVEDVTGIPREYTEFATQLATPGIGFTRLPTAPGTIPRGPSIRPVDVEQPLTAEAAARLQQYNPEVSVPRAVVGSPAEQQRGQQLSNTPYAGVPLIESARTRLPAQLEQTRNIVAAEYGAGDTANVGKRVGTTLQEQAAAEAKAAQDAADAANAKATADWEAANAARTGAIDTAEQQATARAQQTTQEVQAAVGPELHPQDMAAFNIDRTRTAHNSLEARKNALYEEAGNINARISDRANVGIHGFVERSLEHAGIHTQEVEGIRGSRSMLRMLNRYAEAARAREPLAPVGQSMQEVEQLRKNLNLARGTAENPSDERIATHIMNALDDWQARAARDHLMPGSDPRALPAFLDARAANRELMEKFGYNKTDDADKLINKIVRGEVDQHTGENEIARALADSGDKGPIFHRKLLEATNNDPEVAQAIRSGTWNKLTRNDRGEPLPPAQIQKNVTAYLEGKNRALAGQVFDQPQRDLMRAHADTVVETAAQQEAAIAARKVATREAKATAPKEIKPETGDMQKLVADVIGGTEHGEALFKTLHGYARKGGDREQLARVVSKLPQSMRGDLAGAFIRELGVAPGTKQFSLDQFANQWATLTPAAKNILFGASNSHITALNDIATVANQLRQVQGKFGNRSGTAQNSLGALILGVVGTQLVTSPGAAIKTAAGVATTAAGGRLMANLLNKPAGASSIRKYAQAVERAERQQSPIHMAAVKATQRNLANTARALAATQNLTRK